jgi:hypothetical protein
MTLVSFSFSFHRNRRLYYLHGHSYFSLCQQRGDSFCFLQGSYNVCCSRTENSAIRFKFQRGVHQATVHTADHCCRSGELMIVTCVILKDATMQLYVGASGRAFSNSTGQGTRDPGAVFEMAHHEIPKVVFGRDVAARKAAFDGRLACSPSLASTH